MQGSEPAARLAYHLLAIEKRRLPPDEAVVVPEAGRDPAEMLARPAVLDLLLDAPTGGVRAKLQRAKGNPT